MSNSLNQTLFNNYLDILQVLQICQVGEYPWVKIHNVVGIKIPVKNEEEKFKMLLENQLLVIQSYNWLFKASLE